MRLLAVTDVLATVTAPPTNTAVPILAFVPVLTDNPLPIVLISTLPVEEFTSLVNVGAASGAFKLSAVVTNAVVAICVVLVPAPAVGAVGVPVNAGEVASDQVEVAAVYTSGDVHTGVKGPNPFVRPVL